MLFLGVDGTSVWRWTTFPKNRTSDKSYIQTMVSRAAFPEIASPIGSNNSSWLRHRFAHEAMLPSVEKLMLQAGWERFPYIKPKSSTHTTPKASFQTTTDIGLRCGFRIGVDNYPYLRCGVNYKIVGKELWQMSNTSLVTYGDLICYGIERRKTS